MQNREQIIKQNKLLIAAAVAVTTLLQITLIFNYNVWNDEASTIIYSLRDWPHLVGTILVDDHPPLYAVLIKLLISVFGYHFVLVKFFSALPLTLMHIWIGVLVMKNETMRASRHTGVLYALFTLVTTLEHNFMYLSTEVRMYSLAMFFVTMSGVYAWKLYRRFSVGNVAGLCLTTLGGAYTHHFATLCHFFVFLYLLIFVLWQKKGFKRWGVAAGLTILGYSPWLIPLMGQYGEASQGERLTFHFADIRNYFNYVLAMEWPQTLILGTVLLLSLYTLFFAEGRTLRQTIVRKTKATKKEEEQNASEVLEYSDKEEIVFALCCISVIYLCLLVGVLVNLFVRPVFMARYVSPAFGLMWLGIIILLEHVPYRRVVVAIAGALILFLCYDGYTARLVSEYDTGTQKIVSFFQEKAGPQDYIVTNNEHLRISVLGFYFPGHVVKDIDDVDFENDTIEEPASSTGTLPIDRAIWYFEDSLAERDKSFIEDAGYQCLQVNGGDFDNTYYFRLFLIGKK